MLCPFVDHCKRCEISCQPVYVKSFDVRPLPDDENSGDLCVERVNLEEWGEEPLEEIIKKMKPKRIDCSEYVKSAADWACEEALAVYCRQDDTIYYNSDRIQRYLKELAEHNAATFLIQLSRVQGSYFHYITGKVAAVAIENATERATLRYLLSHERYHWAGCCSQDEEALATAWGLYAAYREELKELREIYQLAPKGVYTSGRGQQGITVEYHIHVFDKLSLDFVVALVVEIYAYLLTLARLSFIEYNMDDYKNFVNYISPVFKTPAIKSRHGAEIDAGFLKIDFDLHFFTLEVKSDVSFKGVVRKRSDPLREVWACCKKAIDMSPNPRLVAED